MDESHEVLKSAIDAIGVKKVASDLKLSTALVYKWCQEAPTEDSIASGAYNPLDRIRKIYEATENPQIVNWICQMAGGYFVQNPDPDQLDDEDSLVQNIQKFIREFSETLDSISKSYIDDNHISEKEGKRIRKEWEDLKRIGEAFVNACESGAFNQP